eukprot:TRINITY_DN7426_c0_g1_i1.p2 TRINITY_DN7426_c0_g1~~TRINITY_DN7426_c0_g1_i1.p2  ORF type:complete len:134 (-),score=22.74 TRINITY_DN7426_c0_g1_i1:784-1185(-)
MLATSTLSLSSNTIPTSPIDNNANEETEHCDGNNDNEQNGEDCPLGGEANYLLCQNGLPVCSFPPSWSFIITVTLYTLQHHFGEKNFFHLRRDIYPFISCTTHWDVFGINGYGGDFKRQVQGILFICLWNLAR